MPEFNFPLQADDLLEHNGDRYMVQLPFDVANMAPEEITDMLEGMSECLVLDLQLLSLFGTRAHADLNKWTHTLTSHEYVEYLLSASAHEFVEQSPDVGSRLQADPSCMPEHDVFDKLFAVARFCDSLYKWRCLSGTCTKNTLILI